MLLLCRCCCILFFNDTIFPRNFLLPFKSDMTLEAIACKVAYLFGRQDLSRSEISNLMGVSLRGEGTWCLAKLFKLEC